MHPSQNTGRLHSAAAAAKKKTQVLVGLGAALLSDENHTVGPGVYRPVNLKRIMATLVVQRALKRNMMQKRAKFSMYDIVMASHEFKATPKLLSASELPGEIDSVCVGNSPTCRVETKEKIRKGRGREVHWDTKLGGSGDSYGRKEAQPLREQRPGRCFQEARPEDKGVGSIGLPPGTEERAWRMQNFLLDLQRMNQEDDLMEEDIIAGGRVRRDRRTAVAAASDGTGRKDFLLDTPCDGDPRSGTELGSPIALGPAGLDDGKAYGSDKRNRGRHGNRSGGDDISGGVRGGHRVVRERKGSLVELGWFRRLLPQAWTTSSGEQNGVRPQAATDLEDPRAVTRGHHDPGRGRDGVNDGSMSPNHRTGERGAGGGVEEREEEFEGATVTSLAVWLRGQRPTAEDEK